MSEIKIASLILTRRCNAQCDYCRISGDIDYIISPSCYGGSNYYYNNEKKPDFWIDNINRLYSHNPDIFFILFGGEPLLYDGIIDIVKHLNNIEANYTIISNCIDQYRIDELLENVGSVRGFTASVDPGYWIDFDDSDYEKVKSKMGFNTLKYLIENNFVEDPVAEITVDNNNIQYLEETIKRLDSIGVTSDITIVDISKNNYYDFSSIISEEYIPKQCEEVKEIFDRLINSGYKIHMKEELLSRIYQILPANLDCKLGETIHNINIDSDGMLRLCLRIRGIDVPKFYLSEVLKEDGSWNDLEDSLKLTYLKDKSSLCKGCNHTCQLMSMIGDEQQVKFHIKEL